MISNKLCECGCGEYTNIAPRTDTAKGWKKGEPLTIKRWHTALSRSLWTEDKNTGCWIWQRHVLSNGYSYGKIPEGLHLDHLCKNRKCVNPDHLEPVTPRENSRRSSTCKLNPEDVIRIKQRLLTWKRGDSVRIAKEFGVSQQTICGIRKNRKWEDVKPWAEGKDFAKGE